MRKINCDIPEVDILIDDDKKFVKIVWKEQANNLTPEEGFDLTQKVFDTVLKLNPEYILSDNQASVVAYTKEYRGNIINRLIPKALSNKALKKFALVMSRDLATQINQSILDQELKNENLPWEISFFQSIESAETWLFSK